MSRRPRPSDFSTRMPSADSSTTVARSPTWSWARRAAREYRRSSASVVTVSGHRHDRDDQPEPRREPHQHPDADDDRQRVDHQEDPGEHDEPADRREVRVARDSSWPGGPAVVERHRQPLQVREQVGAHRRLDLVGRAARPAAGAAGSARPRRAPNASTPRTSHGSGAELAAGDRAVDDRAGDQRDRQPGQGGGERGDTAADQCGAVRADVGQQPATGSRRGGAAAGSPWRVRTVAHGARRTLGGRAWSAVHPMYRAIPDRVAAG